MLRASQPLHTFRAYDLAYDTTLAPRARSAVHTRTRLLAGALVGIHPPPVETSDDDYFTSYKNLFAGAGDPRWDVAGGRYTACRRCRTGSD
jgi:hypothetical protein